MLKNFNKLNKTFQPINFISRKIINNNNNNINNEIKSFKFKIISNSFSSYSLLLLSSNKIKINKKINSNKNKNFSENLNTNKEKDKEKDIERDIERDEIINTQNYLNIFYYLNERNLISNISNRDFITNPEITKEFFKENAKIYIGFDPTAESLHLGNLVGILTALRFASFNIEPIFLIGGATGQIGDPSGKNKERPLLEVDKVKSNLEFIKNNLNNLIININNNNDYKNFSRKIQNKNKDNKEFILKYQIIDNMEFYRDLNIIDFLRNIGTSLRMGPMLSRELVKKRLNSNDGDGMSLTEFMYQSFQGFDFLKLYENYNVKIQIGGSDQWANMLAGYELIKKKKNIDIINLTFPLLMTSTGQKFGKSEGNAIFLNKEITPVNTLYQYLYNTTDSDLYNLFNVFTFIEKDEINEIINSHKKVPEKRVAQKILAEKIVTMVYSEEEAFICKKKSDTHYLANKLKNNKDNNKDDNNINLNEKELNNIFKDMEVKELPYNFLESNLKISQFCLDHKLLETKAACKKLFIAGSLIINEVKYFKDEFINKDMLINGKYFIIKTGKKHTHVFSIAEYLNKEIDKNENLNENENENENLDNKA
jgi:tyrosyl-tRNA synthetase